MIRDARIDPAPPSRRVGGLRAFDPGDDARVTVRGDIGRQRRVEIRVFDVVAEIVERHREVAHAARFVHRRIGVAVLHDQHLARQHFDRTDADDVTAGVRHVRRHAGRDDLRGRRACTCTVGALADLDRQHRHVRLTHENPCRVDACGTVCSGDVAYRTHIVAVHETAYQRRTEYRVKHIRMRLRRTQRIVAADDQPRVGIGRMNCLTRCDRLRRVEQEAAITARPQRLDALRDKRSRPKGRARRVMRYVRDPNGVRERVRCRIEASGRIEHHRVERLQQRLGRLRAVEKRDVRMQRARRGWNCRGIGRHDVQRNERKRRAAQDRGHAAADSEHGGRACSGWVIQFVSFRT
ncbi:hypothetical protein DF048_15655 [Burkholderia seminalis]|nr:hypothetical protein DF048_15655 [Burkholderia seminalis]